MKSMGLLEIQDCLRKSPHWSHHHLIQHPKRVQILLVQAWHRTYGLPVNITRCSNNYGPYQYPEKLIPLMISNASADIPLPVYGDGMNVRDWIHVQDHCDALLLVLEQGVSGEVYNIGETVNAEIWTW